MQPLSTILFVDDELRILEGLQGRLRKQRHRWAMEFVCGGDRAMDRLAEQPFDVVVTDLRMPRVDGLAILRHLQACHPETMRIVLSGEPERTSGIEFAPYAHQSLTKPSRPGELEAMLERACALRELVVDPDVRRVLGRIRELPALPRTFARLSAVLSDERAGLTELADVIAADIAVSAKILKLANSAFFGVGRAVSSVSQAIQLLGIDAVNALVLTSSAFDVSRLSPWQRAFSEDLQDHSLLVASLAAVIAGAARREAFAAAMLHDIGRMVLAFERDAPESAGTEPGADASPRTGGEGPASHAKIGAYLLGLWGLPLAVFDAVARHHDEPAPGGPIAHAAIYLGERIAEEAASGGALATPAELESMHRVARERAAELAQAEADLKRDPASPEKTP